jgi:peptide/nickel transport system substrate-binding protein
MGDFVMGMIMTFDRGKPESAIYDESNVPALESYMSVFKGVKVVSTDPLVIETYSDAYSLDAELMADTPSNWWPQYGFGVAPWQTIGLGVKAETAKLATFSTDKADALKKENEKIEWMSFIAGPSLQILSDQLKTATEENYIPYAPTMGEYVTADEATERYANLAQWYREQGHFWLGVGPFYLNKAFPVEGSLSLLRNQDYPDPANKWARFGAPMIAETEVDGPGQVTIGQEAKFDVLVTFNGEPYPADQIDALKFLLFNAKGEVVTVGAGDAADGVYSVTLPADVTSQLEEGSNKLQVAVTSKAVSIPSYANFEFVTVK